MNSDTFYELAQYLDPQSLYRLCQSNSTYRKYCQDPRIRNLYLANKSMTSDIFYNIISHLDYPTIINLCRLNTGYQKYCREPRVQLALKLAKVIDKFQIDGVYSYALEGDDFKYHDIMISYYSQDLDPDFNRYFNKLVIYEDFSNQPVKGSVLHSLFPSSRLTTEQYARHTYIFLYQGTLEDLKLVLAKLDTLGFDINYFAYSNNI